MSVVNTVDLIGDEALTSSIIDRSITEFVDNTLVYIGRSAFAYCTNLTKVDLSVASIIYDGAFEKCSALSTLILRNATMCRLNNAYVLLDTPDSSYFYVPRALIDSYKEAFGWKNHANKFRALEDWTVDGTTTGEFDPNRCMVRFFNDDGTLLGYKVVTKGSDAVWDSDTPVKGEDYEFLGWNPAPTNVTADMDCYAEYKNNAIYTWSAVNAAVADGTYRDVYKLGDLVPLDLGDEGVVNMQLVAFDADDKADGSGKAATTWISENLLHNDTFTNPARGAWDGSGYPEGTGGIGGWEKSRFRTYIQETIMPKIPEDVRSIIKEVTKTQNAHNTAGNAFTQTTIDSVWPPSYREVVGTSSPCYELYWNNSALLLKRRVGATGTKPWWLRDSMNYNQWRAVRANGSTYEEYTNSDLFVVIGFCI